MEKNLAIFQAIVSLLLIVSILLQNRGTSLGETFGGSGGGDVYQTKRGFDKFLFKSTILLAILFIGSAILSVIQNS